MADDYGNWISSYSSLLASAFIYTAIVFLGNVVYKVYFHPLAKVPGPKAAAISNLWYCYSLLSGEQPFDLLKLHETYGPIVRVAPDEISFNSAESWKDIYDTRPGHHVFLKSKFYENGSFADQCGSIVSERDTKEHAQMRKQMSPAFSQRSLHEQEQLLTEFIDRFIEKLKGLEDFDIGQWFNKLTFDIIGRLAFGTNFGGLETGENHPWIQRTLGALRQGALVEAFKRFPWVAKIVTTLLSKKIAKLIEDTKINERYAIDLIDQRIHSTNSSKDFMTRILEARDPEKTSDIQLAAHASDFVLAGSETTATALTCILYYLLKDETVMKRLQTEVVGAFATYKDINAISSARLPYLTAVIQEGMRIYPPLPFGLPRLVPHTGDFVAGLFVKGGIVVSTNPVAACLDERNFRNPLQFDPERWLNPSDDILEASQPFSMGSRACLGQNLAWMEMRLTLCKLLYSYSIEAVDVPYDWHRESKMHTLWRKPRLVVRTEVRV